MPLNLTVCLLPMRAPSCDGNFKAIDQKIETDSEGTIFQESFHSHPL